MEMTKRAYRAIALLTLPLPCLGAYVVGGFIARGLASVGPEGLGTLLGLLGYLLGLLACVVLWGVALWPLRRRAGFESLSGEVARVRRDGIHAVVAEEQEKLAAKRLSADPRERISHHLTFAGVGATFSVGAVAITWALYGDGYVWAFGVAALVVCPALTLHHLVQAALVKLRA